MTPSQGHKKIAAPEGHKKNKRPDAPVIFFPGFLFFFMTGSGDEGHGGGKMLSTLKNLKTTSTKRVPRPRVRPPGRLPERGVRGAQPPGKRKKRVNINIQIYKKISKIDAL